METTASNAALPGVLPESLDSSFTVRALSQPQKEKIDADRPATSAVIDSPVKGLNHSHENVSPVSELLACDSAITENRINTPNWKNTRTNCTFSVVVMPR